MNSRDKESEARFEYEIRMQKEFHNVGIGPEVLKGGITKDGTGGFAMTWVHQTIQDFLKVPRRTEVLERLRVHIFQTLKQLDVHYLIHGDFKWDNMGYIDDEPAARFVLMDFGLSSRGRARLNLEIYSLVRTLPMIEAEKNRDFFRNALRPFFLTIFSTESCFDEELVRWGTALYQYEFYGANELCRARTTREPPVWGHGGFAGGYSVVYDKAVSKFSAKNIVE